MIFVDMMKCESWDPHFNKHDATRAELAFVALNLAAPVVYVCRWPCDGGPIQSHLKRRSKDPMGRFPFRNFSGTSPLPCSFSEDSFRFETEPKPVVPASTGSTASRAPRPRCEIFSSPVRQRMVSPTISVKLCWLDIFPAMMHSFCLKIMLWFKKKKKGHRVGVCFQKCFVPVGEAEFLCPIVLLRQSVPVLFSYFFRPRVFVGFISMFVSHFSEV